MCVAPDPDLVPPAELLLVETRQQNALHPKAFGFTPLKPLGSRQRNVTTTCDHQVLTGQRFSRAEFETRRRLLSPQGDDGLSGRRWTFLLLLPPFISDSPEDEGVEGEVEVKVEVEGRDR